MRIAFLTPEYVTEPNFYGGLANYLARVALGLQQRGHQVEIFTRSSTTETILHNGITIHRVSGKAMRWRILSRLTAPYPVHIFNAMALSHTLTMALKKRHQQQPFDIVQAPSCHACGMFAMSKDLPPLVIRVSSYEPMMREYYRKTLDLNQRLLEFLERHVLRRSKIIYTPSRLLAGIWEKNGVPIKTIRPPFLLNNVKWDSTIYKEQLAGKKYLLFFGTLGLLKGGEVLAKSIPQILKQYPDMWFVFAGKVIEGSEKVNMLQEIRNKTGEHSNRIISLGALHHPRLYPIIQNSHAVVLPSLIDNLPNTMLEAMGLGKIVIGTRGASFDEMIEDGISGILVNRNDPEGLVVAMKRVWEMKKEEVDSIGAQAIARISQLSPDVTCRQLEGYFEKIIKELKKLKILYILNQRSFPSSTMSQTFIIDQMTSLIDLGHDVQVVASLGMEPGTKMHPDVIKYNLLDKIRYFEPPNENKFKRVFRSGAVAMKIFILHPFIFLKAIKSYKFCQKEFVLDIFYLINNLLEFSEFDIVNCHFGVNGRLAVLLRDIKVLKGKIVTTFHGMDTRYNVQQEQVLYKEFFKKADQLIAISSFNQKYLLSIGANPKKILRLPMGIDTNKFAFREKLIESVQGKIQILTVARLSEEKGLPFSIEAVSLLKQINKELSIRYYIVGDGPERDNLMKLIERLGLKGTVGLLGAMNQQEVIKIMTESDLFILPSTREALPVVLMEAQSIGLPSIATDVGGIKEIVIDGKSGYIVASKDVKAMTQKLGYLIDHPEIRVMMGQKGREFVEEHYNFHKLNGCLVRIYKELIKDGR